MDNFPVSDLINIETFYHTWKNKQMSGLNKFENIVSDYGFYFDQIEQDCSEESLKHCHELSSMDEMLAMYPTRKHCPPLQTLNNLPKLQTNPNQQSSEEIKNGEYKMAHKLKERLLKPTVDLQCENTCMKSMNIDESHSIDDVIITVIIFKPNAYPAVDLQQNKPDSYFMSNHTYGFKRLDVLGNQLLTDLKDAIACPQDYLWLGDCSDSLDDAEKHVMAKDIYPSSYFFIENTFYNDMRHPAAKDLSSSVISWMRSSVERSNEFGEVRSNNMEGIRFRSLQVRLGKCYLYVHQGNCEHFLVFSDMRLSDKLDCRDPSLFPILTGKAKTRGIFCKICLRNRCFWLVRDTDLIPESPCPMCDHCLRLLLYTKDGKKKDNFKVFKFLNVDATNN